MTALFERWKESTPKNNDALRKRVEQTCKVERRYQLQWLQKLCFIPNLSKWLHPETPGGGGELLYQQYAALAFHGITHGWIGGDPETRFKEFSSFIGNNPAEAPRRAIEHNLIVYRRSFLAPGYILRGPLRIWREKDTVAIETFEYHCIQAEVADRCGRGKKDMPFPRSGNLFPRGNENFLLVSRKDEFQNEIQISYLKRTGDFSSLEGPFSDWHTDKLYSGNMIAVHAPSALPISAAKAMTENEINKIEPTIIPRLNAMGICE